MLKKYLKKNNKILENKINEFLDELTYPQIVVEGMKYAVLNGGKRIRPNLLFMILDLFDQKIELGLPTAIAIEMIHSYSLVHDDLPALDNDNYRRGKLTTHKMFGEANGILIGDALLTHAFYILTEKNKSLIDTNKIVEIVRKTASYAGVNGMIGGQVVDIESEHKKIDLKTLKYIHANKTGKLLTLPIECGCIIANASTFQITNLIKIANLIGISFQIKDDILDIEGTFEEIGKPVGSDIDSEKSTYPSILGLEKSKEILKDTITEAKNILLQHFDNKKINILLELMDYLESRKS